MRLRDHSHLSIFICRICTQKKERHKQIKKKTRQKNLPHSIFIYSTLVYKEKKEKPKKIKFDIWKNFHRPV